jgi:hypothetical protein
MTPYEQFIDQQLQKEAFILGTDLNARVVGKFLVKPDNARKILERAAKQGHAKASPITFGKRQLAYIHPSKKFTKELVLAIAKENRPTLYRLVAMLDYFKGVLPFHDAMKVCATPIETSTAKSDSIQKLISEIEEMEFGRRYESDEGKMFILYPSKIKEAEGLCNAAFGNMTTDVAFIPDILRALRKYNIIDNDKVLYRNKVYADRGVTYNNYMWDAIAYTRTTGINDLRSSEAKTFDKQTLVVLDIVITRPYTHYDLDGFLSRIQGVINSVREGQRKVLPIVVISSAESRKVINQVRALGFICFDLGVIYGSHVYQIIERLVQVKKYSRANSPSLIPVEDVIGETLGIIQAAGLDNNLSNLKGDLFESLMFPTLRILFPDATIEQDKKLESAEGTGKKMIRYDYVINSVRLNEITVLELKGFASTRHISLGSEEERDTIKWFFGYTFQFAAKALQKEFKNAKITACLITTTSISPEGVDFLETVNRGGLKPHELDVWYDGMKLIQMLKDKKIDKAQELIKKYFLVDARETNLVEPDDLPF